jgi:hypothetical protein
VVSASDGSTVGVEAATSGKRAINVTGPDGLTRVQIYIEGAMVSEFLLLPAAIGYFLAAMFTGFMLDDKGLNFGEAALCGLWWPVTVAFCGAVAVVGLVAGFARRYMTAEGKRQRRLERKRNELEMLREEREIDEQIDAELQKILGGYGE